MTSVYWSCLILLIPLGVGFYQWKKSAEITHWEWILGVAAAAIVLGITFMVADMIAGVDEEIYSGHAQQAVHTPWWQAEWEEWVPPTYDDKGNQTGGGYYRTVTENHPEQWWFETTIGRIDISEETWNQVVHDHSYHAQEGHRPDFNKGDRNDYCSEIPELLRDGPEYPVHRLFKWDNPLIGTDTVNLGREISEEEAEELNLFEYPEVNNSLVSNRVINSAVSTYRWDQMCGLLGPVKKVNLILINFGERGMTDAVNQKDYWRNGRKNDLVLCYGEGWSYVFGWSKSALVKQELQSLLVEEEVNDDLLPKIDEIVRRDFEPYEWKMHAGTPRPVSAWAVFFALLFTGLSQWGLWYLFHTNKWRRDRPGFLRFRS